MRTEEEIRDEALMEIARKMLVAARTAPKGKGEDNMVLLLCDRDDIRKIADYMIEKHAAGELDHFFQRDAQNILSASAMILAGSRIKPLGLKKCGMCGFESCEEKSRHPRVPCAFNTGDLGIALGSAASIAADNRVDNRIMYTVGQAVLDMGIMGEGVTVAYGLPISASAKSPFFDRKSSPTSEA